MFFKKELEDTSRKMQLKGFEFLNNSKKVEKLSWKKKKKVQCMVGCGVILFFTAIFKVFI